MSVEYDIANDYNLQALVGEVQEKLDAGWVLQGGIAIEKNGKYYQAMIKHRTPAEPPTQAEGPKDMK